MPLEIGATLQERYRIDAALSEHVNGGVYRAHDLQADQPCIVKEVLDLPAEDFKPAAQALLNRIHPTLPEVFDHFSSDDERHYLVMEFVEGESLASRLERLGALTEREAATWVGQVLAALDYLHNRTPPILHGDVKPTNVLITPDGEAVLVDYGIHQTLNPHTPVTLVAPEQVAGNSETRSDVYAAGATLYTALTGQIPGQGGHSDRSQLADRFAIAPPRKLNAALSPAMARVIEKAMAHKADARFESIREMRKALGRAGARTDAVHDEIEAVVRAAPPAPDRRARVWWGWIAAAVAAAAIAGIFEIASSRATTNPPATMTPTAEAAVALPEPSATALPAATPTAAPTDTPAPTATYHPSVEDARQGATPRVPTFTLAPTLGVGSSTISPVDGASLVYVPAGEFIMGSTLDDPLSFDDERPQHVVEIPAFWIDQTEVTNAQYRACIAAGACTELKLTESATRPDYYENAAYDDYPVVWIEWSQAAAYCAWAGRRLPSEPEWEKAARGTDGRRFPWGDELDEEDETHANFGTLVGDTTAGGNYPAGASPYGALDMAGNVAEWVADFYSTTYYNHVERMTATPAATERFHNGLYALRNGSWNDNLANIRAASRRFAGSNDYRANNVGFRCAVSKSSS